MKESRVTEAGRLNSGGLVKESTTSPADFDETRQRNAMFAESGHGTSYLPDRHASLFAALSSVSPKSAAAFTLSLQGTHGNRYVQRVLDLARKDDGEPGCMAEIERSIESARGGGEALDGTARRSMEKAFGNDFSNVRIHTGSESDQLNRALNARAFTTGSDIFFREGEYSPASSAGRHLLAHELTHVVQQGGGVKRKLTVSERGDESEREAEMVSGEIMKSFQEQISGGHLERQAEEEEEEAVQAALATPDVSRQSPEDDEEKIQAFPVSIMRQGRLTPAEEALATSYTANNYNSRSVRIIQDITGTTVNGVFGGRTAEAVAVYQNANGIHEDGMTGEDTLNFMVPNRAAASLHEHAIQLVADFYDLDVRSDTLTVHYDATLATAGASSFEPGNLRVIRVGPPAFVSAPALRDAIRNELATPAPAAAVPGPRPDHLTPPREQAAVGFNRSHYQDRRSVRAIQGVVGGALSGTFDGDTAERIAEFQSTNPNGLQVDGKVGRDTLREMVNQLNAAGQQNAAIRLIIDFFDLSEQGALLDISYDPTVAANASTSGVIPGPAVVRVGPSGFAQGFEGLVHTIAHELEHVRQRREGILNRDIREFLGESIEILSAGMPEENLAGFMDDAGRAISHWNNLSNAEKRSYWARFTRVRRRVRERFNAASAAEKALNQATMDAYNAVVYPPP